MPHVPERYITRARPSRVHSPTRGLPHTRVTFSHRSHGFRSCRDSHVGNRARSLYPVQRHTNCPSLGPRIELCASGGSAALLLSHICVDCEAYHSHLWNPGVYDWTLFQVTFNLYYYTV